MKKLLISFFLFISVFIGCNENPNSSNNGGSYDYEAEINDTQKIDLSGQTTFILENTNGNISITAADTTNNLNLKIRKKVRSRISHSDAQSHISDINISINENVDNVKLKATNPSEKDRSYTTDFEIVLPDNFDYNITLGNGNIFMFSTTNCLTINLGNGNVESNLRLQNTCQVQVSIGNGSLFFNIPDSTNANLHATVGNGIIRNNGLNFQNQHTMNNQFSGMLGNGNGEITLNVGNGIIEMNKH